MNTVNVWPQDYTKINELGTKLAADGGGTLHIIMANGAELPGLGGWDGVTVEMGSAPPNRRARRDKSKPKPLSVLDRLVGKAQHYRNRKGNNSPDYELMSKSLDSISQCMFKSPYDSLGAVQKDAVASEYYSGT